jgi:hypothetical protein
MSLLGYEPKLVQLDHQARGQEGIHKIAVRFLQTSSLLTPYHELHRTTLMLNRAVRRELLANALPVRTADEGVAISPILGLSQSARPLRQALIWAACSR